MGTPNYKQIETLIADKIEFKHGYSMSAQRTAYSYRIYSYTTCIARYDFESGEWWIDDKRYSVTTSKQQNIVRRVAKAEGWVTPDPLAQLATL